MNEGVIYLLQLCKWKLKKDSTSPLNINSLEKKCRNVERKPKDENNFVFSFWQGKRNGEVKLDVNFAFQGIISINKMLDICKGYILGPASFPIFMNLS